MKSIPWDEWFPKFIQTDEEAAGYLDECFKDEDPRVFLLALRDVAMARGGIQAVAKKAELHRVHMNRILSDKGNPELSSLVAILGALGFRLGIVPIAENAPVKPAKPPRKPSSTPVTVAVSKTFIPTKPVRTHRKPISPIEPR